MGDNLPHDDEHLKEGTQAPVDDENYGHFDQNAHMFVPGNHHYEGEDLRQALIGRLEYVFSLEYLASDPVLVSRLDADFYAPISVIEELPIIRTLSTDSKLINAALRSSNQIVVDEEKQMVKPVFKLVQRNTIILRDIPDNTTEQDIKALWQGQRNYDDAIVEMKPECGSTFFLKFKDEETALDAFSYLRTQKLGGMPVQARIKSENLLKSFYYDIPSDGGAFQSNGNTRPPGRFSRGEGRGYDGKSRTGSPPWSSRKKEYRGKAYEGKGRGRNRHPKKGYGGGPSPRGDRSRSNVLPIAPSHWPPLGDVFQKDNSSHTGEYQTQKTNTDQGSHTAPASSAATTSVPPSSADPPTSSTTPTATKPETTNSTPITAWAVSNSAVKKPPTQQMPKRSPNPPPHKKNKQKQQPQPQPQQPQNTQQQGPGKRTGPKSRGPKQKQYAKQGARPAQNSQPSETANNSASSTTPSSGSHATTIPATSSGVTSPGSATVAPAPVTSTPAAASTVAGNGISATVAGEVKPSGSPKLAAPSYADIVRPSSPPGVSTTSD